MLCCVVLEQCVLWCVLLRVVFCIVVVGVVLCLGVVVAGVVLCLDVVVCLLFLSVVIEFRCGDCRVVLL